MVVRGVWGERWGVLRGGCGGLIEWSGRGLLGGYSGSGGMHGGGWVVLCWGRVQWWGGFGGVALVIVAGGRASRVGARGGGVVLGGCGDGLVILDGVYVGCVDENWASSDLVSRGNIVMVRSMTKDYALAGLRLGYAVANEEIISALRRVCPPWNVNVVAQQAGVVVLEDADYLERCLLEIRKTKRFLVDELGRIGFTLLPSSTNFFLVKVANAPDFRTALLRHGILVRDCTSFGLPQYIRLAARTMPECQKLIATIQTMQDKGELEIIP